MSTNSNAKTSATAPATTATKRERDETMDERLSDSEALMWKLEAEPQLNPSGAALTLYDQPIDMDRLRRTMAWGVTQMPRLYQRLLDDPNPMTTPRWVPDPYFDLDYHVMEIDLGGDADQRDLFDMAAQIYQEPLDRERPLWRIVVINGLADGTAATYSLIHHVVADGIGQLRITELYLDYERDPDPVPEVDLDAFIATQVAADLAANTNETEGGIEAPGGQAGKLATFIIGQQVEFARKMLGEVMIWPADPERATKGMRKVASTTLSTVDQLKDIFGDDNDGSGSPLWTNRSARRHLEHVRVEMDDLKRASKVTGASINELFVAGLAEATERYHRRRNSEISIINTSIVVSTRTDKRRTGNQFTPMPIQVPGAAQTMADRLTAVKAAADEAIASAKGGKGLMAMANILNLLPTSMMAKAALDRAGRLDFATSNLRGAARPVYCGGAKATGLVTMGPLAGTPMNATAMSYDGHFDIGMFIDPNAISDPGELAMLADQVFQEIVALTSAPDPVDEAEEAAKMAVAAPAKKKAAKKRPAKRATKKATAKKATAKKATAKKKAAPKKAAKKSTTKKSTTKKSTAKKSTAKKSTAKKRTASKKKATATASKRASRSS